MMRVKFERAGGFAGIHLVANVDSTSISPQEERELRDMIKTSGLFHFSERTMTTTPRADRFIYKVTVEEEGRQYTVEMYDAEVPSQVRPLLKWLTVASRKSHGVRGTR